MKKYLLITIVCLLSQKLFAAQEFLSCSFVGLNEKGPNLELGTTKKLIDPKYDFSIEIPKTKNKDWSVLSEGLMIAGSVEFPKKGWVGLAYSSREKPNDGWACIKFTKGNTLILTQTVNKRSIQAHCIVE